MISVAEMFDQLALQVSVNETQMRYNTIFSILMELDHIGWDVQSYQTAYKSCYKYYKAMFMESLSISSVTAQMDENEMLREDLDKQEIVHRILADKYRIILLAQKQRLVDVGRTLVEHKRKLVQEQAKFEAFARSRPRPMPDTVSVQQLVLEKPSAELTTFFSAVSADAQKQIEASQPDALDQEIGFKQFFNAVSAEAKDGTKAGQRDAGDVVRQFATSVRGLRKRFFSR